MKESFQEIIDICVEKMRRGASLQEIAKEYPAYAGQIEEMLSVAGEIGKSLRPVIPEGAVERCHEKAGETLLRRRRSKGGSFSPFSYFSWNYALAGMSAAVVLLTGAVFLSEASLPGDILYPVKMFGECVRCRCSFSSERRAGLYLCCSKKRIRELEALWKKKGEMDTGLITAMFKKTSLALREISSMKSGEQEIYYAQMGALLEYQRRFFEVLRDQVPSRDRRTVERAFRTCCYRVRWINGQSAGSSGFEYWGPECTWDGK